MVAAHVERRSPATGQRCASRPAATAVRRPLLPRPLLPRPRGAQLRLVPPAGAGPSGAVYRRRRAVALTGAAVLVIGLWFALQAAVGGAGGGPLTATGAVTGSPAAARVWVVQPGDTLWSIALRAGASGDIRPVVDRLAAATGGRPLQVGERIPLP